MGHRHHHKLEDTKQSDSDQKSTSSNAQLEVDQLRKTSDTAKHANKSDRANSDLPGFNIVDSSQEKDRSYEEIKPNGNLVLHLQSAAGGTSEIEYNDRNQPIRYRDFSNAEYTNSEPEKTDGIWKSTSSRVQNDGVTISFDKNTNTATLTDLYTKNIVTTTAGGVETTNYFPSNGQTTSKVVGNEEWISTHDKTGSVREMYIVDNKLQRYTDDRNITYTLTGETTPPKRKNNDPTEPLSCNPVYKAEGPDGQPIPGKFTISANRTGNVLVRDEDRQTDSDCCRRTRVDGAVVTSNGDGTVRKFRTADGVEIGTQSKKDDDGSTQTTKTILNPDGSRIEATLKDGVAQSVKQTDANGQVNESKRNFGAEEDFWVNQNDETVDDPSKLATTTALEDGPVAIQKSPVDINLQEMLKDCEQHSVGWTNPGGWKENSQWFLKSVNYGGRWDVKSPSTRTTNADGEELVIKDQLGRPEYEEYGNWLFGVMGNKVGFSSHTLQEEAGAAQIKEGTSRPEWGRPGVGTRGIRIPFTATETYGDDPHDNELIQQGFNQSQQVEEEVTKAA